MTEWVAIFRESGLGDDVTIQNLQDASLRLVVAGRACAPELQVDMQVEKANKVIANKVIVVKAVQPAKKESNSCTAKPCRYYMIAEGCRNGDQCKFKHERMSGYCLR